MTVVINGTTGISTPGLSNSSTSTNTGNVTNSGTVTNASTISVGNATPSASGAGITFPATQSASTDANTLDDYEEGTFTSTIGYSTSITTATSANATTTVTGTYIKIGKFVQVSFPNLTRSSTFGGSSVVIFYMTLPFVVGGESGWGVLVGNYNLSARYQTTTFSSWISWTQANAGTTTMQIGTTSYNLTGGGYLSMENASSNATFGCVYIASA